MLIPNNIDLDAKPTLARQLASYQANFKVWWDERGPTEFHDVPMYLRCPVGCDTHGWAEFRYVRPSEYRWGLFQTPARDRSIEFGDNNGNPVWSHVPSDCRQLLLQHITVQADAEPGSVEQSRLLSRCAPSLYDLRNLLQFLLEEGRHLWALVHILIEHFGPDGVVEAQALLERQCGNAEQPRLLEAFNFKIDEWLSYFLWCFLADRDGKYQLSAVRRSAFDPLARTCEFMLMEEPFHLSIGTHGLERIIRRTMQLMQLHDTEDIFPFGGIPCYVIQKYLNFWAPKVFDLFGSDESQRSRELFSLGLRGPPPDARVLSFTDMHDKLIAIDRRRGDRVVQASVPLPEALNAGMRKAFCAEVNIVIARWNRLLVSNDIAFRFSLPHERFNRQIGPWSGLHFAPDGCVVSAAEFMERHHQWLPTDTDRMRLQGLMQQVLRPSAYAGWIAPPSLGINGKSPTDFEYVLL